MKYCKHCGAKNKNSSDVCISCRSSDFYYICANCGARFSGSTHCPRCGLKAGRSSKTCPNCGEVYFSKSCPKCWYSPDPSKRSHGSDLPNKRVSFGVVLLWIFFLPVMAIIAIWKSGRLTRAAQIVLTAAITLVYVALGASSIGDKNAPPSVSTASLPPIFSPTVYASDPTAAPVDLSSSPAPAVVRESSSTPVQDDTVYVWIPTNGGTKYHSAPTCSGMDNPDKIPLESAMERGFEPCGRCH